MTPEKVPATNNETNDAFCCMVFSLLLLKSLRNYILEIYRREILE
jgi:hypothetical protein